MVHCIAGSRVAKQTNKRETMHKLSSLDDTYQSSPSLSLQTLRVRSISQELEKLPKLCLGTGGLSFLALRNELNIVYLQINALPSIISLIISLIIIYFPCFLFFLLKLLVIISKPLDCISTLHTCFPPCFVFGGKKHTNSPNPNLTFSRFFFLLLYYLVAASIFF